MLLLKAGPLWRMTNARLPAGIPCARTRQRMPPIATIGSLQTRCSRSLGGAIHSGEEYIAGVWCYEIGRGDRVYYKPDLRARKAIVYYAGPHPPKAPPPPRDL